jgi:hypothetical protein
MGELGTGDDDKNWNKIGMQGWENLNISLFWLSL